MPNSMDKAMPSTEANIDVMPLALQKNGSSSEWRRQTLSPSGNIIPMQNAGGAKQHRHQNAHVGGCRSGHGQSRGVKVLRPRALSGAQSRRPRPGKAHPRRPWCCRSR